jgi:cellulose synthase operon protein C
MSDSTPPNTPSDGSERVRSRTRKRRSRRIVVDGDLVPPGSSSSGKRRSRRTPCWYKRKRVVFTALFFSAFAALAVITTSVIDLARLSGGGYEGALTRYRDGDYRGAIISLTSLVQSDPGNLSGRILLGRAYLRAGYAKEAEVELQRALAAGADANAIVTTLGRAFLAQGKFDELFETLSPTVSEPELRRKILTLRGTAHLRLLEVQAAEEQFIAALEADPGAFGPTLGRAQVAIAQGRFPDAAVFLEQVITAYADRPAAWWHRGKLRAAQLKTEAALADFNRALELEPSYVDALMSRAWLALQAGLDEQLEADVAAISKIRPDLPEGIFLSALALARSGEVKDAVAALDRASQGLVRLHSAYLRRHPPGLLIQGIVRYRAGQIEEAHEFLRRYLELRPHDAHARKLVAELLIVRGRARAAIQILEPVLERDSNDVRALVLQGRAHLWLRSKERANELFESATARDPDSATLQMELAFTRLVQSGSTDASSELEAAIDAGTPGPIQAGSLLASLQLRAGDEPGARRTANVQVQRRPDSAAAHNLLGAVLYLTGNSDRARPEFERALSLDPDYLVAMHNIARIDAANGDFDNAKRQLNDVLARDPENLAAMIGLARLGRRAGKDEEALRWYEKIRTHADPPLEPLMELLDLHLGAERVHKAQKLVADLQTQFPRSVEVRVARGRVELAGGDHSRASQTFTTLAQGARASADRLLEFARFQLAANDIDAARTTLEQALETDWAHVGAQLLLAEVDLNSGRHSEALARSRMVAESSPDVATAHKLAGDALVRLGRSGDAAAAYAAGFAIDETTDLAVRLFEARRQAGQVDPAIADLEAWASRRDDATDARRALAIAYLEAGHLDKALPTHEALIELLPNDPHLLRNLASLYLAGRDERALDLAERAFRAAPRDALVLDTLGWVLVTQGEVNEALTHLREAHSRAARNPTIRYHIGAALAKLSRNQEARRELDGALNLAIPFPEREAAQNLRASL